MQPKVSVIVPIYKVEKFIKHCTETLFKQTMREVEYIFVNDATPDKSMEILNNVLIDFPERKPNVHILSHEKNKGLPTARNTGLAIAKGDYIFHCDSDDFVESSMLEDMYTKAVEKNADIVWSDWYLSYKNSERYMGQPNYETPLVALKSMLSGGMKFNVWNKLVKQRLYTDNNISFPDEYGMGEDMTMIMLFSCARKVAYIPKAYYHYVKLNAEAFSQTYSAKHLVELKYNVQRIADYIQAKYGCELEKELAFFKLETKFPFLISDGSNGKYQLWKSWYPEANKYIMANKHVSLRSRTVQWLAWKGQWWLVRLYYQVVIKLIYSVFYR